MVNLPHCPTWTRQDMRPFVQESRSAVSTQMGYYRYSGGEGAAGLKKEILWRQPKP
jgi:hypothetical protein